MNDVNEMNDAKEGHAPNGHMPVSNEPEETAEVVPVEEQVSQPFEGEGLERLAETVQTQIKGIEAVPGYEQIRATLTKVLTDPDIVLPAPDTTRLRPIGEASFGPLPEPESLIGVDDRIQIADTSIYPWCAMAQLLITTAGGLQGLGTGWFIGPRTLVTAGHCVFIHAPGTSDHGWARSIEVMPGRNGILLPFGKGTSTQFRSVTAWTNNKDQNYDYGAIILPTEMGKTVGWLGFGTYPDSELLASTGNISGYPGDKPDTQWFHARQIASVNPTKVFYDIDTIGGQSGSAVFRLVNGQRYGVAVHAYGGSVNSGTRITQSVYNNLLVWRV
jgi:glutamyl endopeptidase